MYTCVEALFPHNGPSLSIICVYFCLMIDIASRRLRFCWYPIRFTPPPPSGPCRMGTRSRYPRGGPTTGKKQRSILDSRLDQRPIDVYRAQGGFHGLFFSIDRHCYCIIRLANVEFELSCNRVEPSTLGSPNRSSAR